MIRLLNDELSLMPDGTLTILCEILVPSEVVSCKGGFFVVELEIVKKNTLGA
jgi:hypothetical protein